MSINIINSSKNFLILQNNEGFEYGLLFPHNIVFEGEDMSVVFSNAILNKIREGIINLE